MLQDEEIHTEGLEEVLHSQKDATESKPRLTDKEMVGGKDFRTGEKSKLNPPKRKPTNFERKKMVAIAMSIIVEKVMTNFLYTFRGKDRRQKDGGPIGDVLTQAMSRHMGNEFGQFRIGRFRFVRLIQNGKPVAYRRVSPSVREVSPWESS